MASRVLVTNGATNISAANGFVKAEVYNVGGYSTGVSSALSTPLAIPVTFTTGSRKNSGVILALSISANNIDRSLYVSLQQIMGTCTVNAGTDEVTFTSHGFSDGQGVMITAATTQPGGITANTIFYARATGSSAPANTFFLYDTAAHAIAGGGTGLVNITSTGTGTLTLYAERGAQTQTSSTILNSLSVNSLTTFDTWYTPFSWTGYTIDSTAGKWRFWIIQQGGTAANWFYRYSSAVSNPFFIEVSDIAATFDLTAATNADLFVAKDILTIDQSAAPKPILGTGDSANGICGIICKSSSGISASSNNENLQWVITPAAPITLSIDGCLVLGAHSGMRIGTAITFTGALSAGATSATLNTNWAGTTGDYQVTFWNGLDGMNTESTLYMRRYVTLTNGATTATWTGGLEEDAVAYGNVAVNNSSKATISLLNRSVGTTASGIYDNLITGTGYATKGSLNFYGEIPSVEKCELLSTANVGATAITTATDVTAGEIPWSDGDVIAIGKSDTTGVGSVVPYTISGVPTWDGSKSTINLTSAIVGNNRLATTDKAPALILRLNGYGIKITSNTTTRGSIYAKHASNFHIEGCQFDELQIIVLGYTTYANYFDENSYKSQLYVGHSSNYSNSTTAVFGAMNIEYKGCLFENISALRADFSSIGIVYSTGGFSTLAVIRNCFAIASATNSSQAVTGCILKDCIFNNGALWGTGIFGVKPTVKDNKYWGMGVNGQYPALQLNCIDPTISGNYINKSVGTLSFYTNTTSARIDKNYFDEEAASTYGPAFWPDQFLDVEEVNPVRVDALSAFYPSNTIQNGSRYHIVNKNDTVGWYFTYTRQGYFKNDRGVCTITIDTPAVVTNSGHGLVAGDEITFSTTGVGCSLPTGITKGTSYYVLSTDLTADTFKFSTSSGGSPVDTSGTQSGTHYLIVKRKLVAFCLRTDEALYSNYNIDTHEISGNKVYISVKARIEKAAFYAGTHTNPTITVTYDDTSTATDSASDSIDEQILETIFTPSSDNKKWGLSITQKTDATEANSPVVYYDLNCSVRKYGYVFSEYATILNDTNHKAATLFSVLSTAANPFITQATQATVDAYTGITIDHNTQTVTLSESHTLKELYDFAQSDLTTDANMGYSEWFTTIDGVNYSSAYDIVLNTGVDLTGGGSVTMAAGKTFTRTGTATYDGIVVNADGTRTVHVKLNGLVAGSVVQVYNTSDSSEIDKTTVSGTIYDYYYTYSADKNIRVRVRYVSGTTGYLPYEATGTIANTGFSLNVAQESAAVYDANNFDGSTATEFSMTEGVIGIFVDDPDNRTTAQRMYNWYLATISNSTYIDDQTDLITAQTSWSYVLDDSLKIENLDLSNPLYLEGANINNTTGNGQVVDTAGGTVIINGYFPFSSAQDVAKTVNALTVGGFLALK